MVKQHRTPVYVIDGVPVYAERPIEEILKGIVARKDLLVNVKNCLRQNGDLSERDSAADRPVASVVPTA